MPWWLTYVAVGVVVLAGIYALRTPPRVTVPSHLPGYRELHDSVEWRAMKARLIRVRARGNCEHRWCRRTENLQLHILVYDCLYEGRLPFDYEVKVLCTPRHHGPADRRRRAWERTRRGRRHYARLVRQARARVAA